MNLYLYKQVLAICCIFEKLAAQLCLKYIVHSFFWHIRYILGNRLLLVNLTIILRILLPLPQSIGRRVRKVGYVGACLCACSQISEKNYEHWQLEQATSRLQIIEIIIANSIFLVLFVFKIDLELSSVDSSVIHRFTSVE